MFYLSARGFGDRSVAPSGARTSDGDLEGLGRSVAGAARCRPQTEAGVVVMIRKGGKGQLILGGGDGSESRTLAAPIDAQGAAGWSSRRRCDCDWGQRRAGPRALRVTPVDGGTPVTRGQGPGRDPVWSPDGGLIVYAVTSVGGHQPLAAVQPDGTAVEGSGTNRNRRPRAPSSKKGKGLVYLETLLVARGRARSPTSGCRIRHQNEEAPGALLTGQYARTSISLPMGSGSSSTA